MKKDYKESPKRDNKTHTSPKNNGLGVFYPIFFIVGISFIVLFATLPNDLNSITSEGIQKTDDIDSIHEEMLYFIKSPKKTMPSKFSEIQKHQDYNHFFNLLKFGNLPDENKNNVSKNNILSRVDKNTFVELVYLNKKTYNFKSDDKLVITGAYTSSYKRPVGLFTINGEIINPAIRDWSGLVIISNGKVYIENAKNIVLNFRRLNIVDSLDDLRVFIDWVEDNKASVFQSHLVVNNSLPKASSKNAKFRRRMIYEDINNDIFIYDSYEKELTLFDAANFLIKEHNAIKAVNLDMGTYNYCNRKLKNGIENCGYLKDTTILSNVLRLKTVK